MSKDIIRKPTVRIRIETAGNHVGSAPLQRALGRVDARHPSRTRERGVHGKGAGVGKQIQYLDARRPLTHELPGISMIEKQAGLKAIVEQALKPRIAFADDHRTAGERAVHHAAGALAGPAGDRLEYDRPGLQLLDTGVDPRVHDRVRNIGSGEHHHVVEVAVDDQTGIRTVARAVHQPIRVDRLDR